MLIQIEIEICKLNINAEKSCIIYLLVFYTSLYQFNFNEKKKYSGF